MSEYIIRQDKDRVLNPSEYDLIEEKNRKEGVILAEKIPKKILILNSCWNLLTMQ